MADKKVVVAGATGLVGNAALITKIYFPRLVIPISNARCSA